ncbi:phosphoglucosamine mutase [Limosilactobacillus fermentum]
MGKYFGTDGFRGEAGITLTADHAYKVGRFLGWYYNMLRERNGNSEPARIVIGKDTRRSSYMFEYSLVAGLTASGADAYLLHVTTTPSVAYIARVDDFDCGIMISASHNPYYDNGIKLIDCYGEKMPEETLLLVEDYIDGKLHVFDKDWPELPFAHREHIGCTVDYVSGRNRYMGYLISLGIYSFKGVKVGLDCANGSSWNIAKSVFDALGADTYVINAQPNGTNINNNAGSTHIEGLQKFVVEKGLDIGFAYDGDADRCLCVDEKGNVITGDHILYIYGCYMKERGKLLTNTVVTTVMSNFGLYKAFDEQSSHIIFSKYASAGDGILTSLKMMEVMLAKKLPMSKLAEPLKIYPQVLENVRVTDKKAAQDDEAVQAAVKAVAEALGDTGRILVRESGTEPVVRVMVEAPDYDTEVCVSGCRYH